MTGIIKSFSPKSGYGFIGGGSVDVFFHRKDWLADGKPEPGQEVWFLLKKTNKGYRAYKIRRM